MAVLAYWILAPYVGWFQRYRASWGVFVASLWNLRRATWMYPGMETLTFLLT